MMILTADTASAAAACCAGAALAAGTFPTLPMVIGRRAAARGAPRVPPATTTFWLGAGSAAAAAAAVLIIIMALAAANGAADIALDPPPLNAYALLAGALWVLAVIGRIESIGALGLCVASAVAEPAAALAAFGAPSPPPRAGRPRPPPCANLPAAGGALLLAAAAAQALALHARMCRAAKKGGEAAVESVDNDADGAAAEAGDGALEQALLPSPPLLAASRDSGDGGEGAQRARGAAWAVLSGACVGLAPAVEAFVTPSRGGCSSGDVAQRLLASGIGMAVVAFGVVVAQHAASSRRCSPPNLRAGDAAALGALAGALLCAAGALRAAAAALGGAGIAGDVLAHAPALVGLAYGALAFGELRGSGAGLVVMLFLTVCQILIGGTLLAASARFPC